MSPFLEVLLTGPYMPFSVALGIMAAIGVLEAIGLGISLIDIDFDGDFDTDHEFLSWLGFGHVPLMAITVSCLTIFGLSGMIGQNVMTALTGQPLTLWAMVPLSLIVTFVLGGYLSNLLGRIMPGEETTVISDDDILGKRATILFGSAEPGNPNKAKYIDQHGQSHYVLVEPDFGRVSEGDELILTRKENGVFIGTAPYSTLRSIT